MHQEFVPFGQYLGVPLDRIPTDGLAQVYDDAVDACLDRLAVAILIETDRRRKLQARKETLVPVA